jgi:hypothetical protein
MSPPLFPVGVPPGNTLCIGKPSFFPLVDAPSRQSEATQDVLSVTHLGSFCGTTDDWIISADTGIHPTVAGHAQFAAALQTVVDQNGLGPPSS